MDEGLKIKGIKYLNVETRLLFSHPIKNSGYAPAKGILTTSLKEGARGDCLVLP